MWKKKMVKEVMEGFDFHTVHKVMQMTWWKWALPEWTAVPTLKQVERFASNMIMRCCEEAKASWCSSSASWWFECTVTAANGKIDLVELKFVLEENAAFK